jgi:hypothetical protein
MNDRFPNRKEFAVVAVPSVEEAREVLLASGLFALCSENSVIDKQTGVEIRLVPLSGNN